MPTIVARFRVKPALVYRLVKAYKRDPCFLDGAQAKRKRMLRKEASIIKTVAAMRSKRQNIWRTSQVVEEVKASSGEEVTRGKTAEVMRS